MKLQIHDTIASKSQDYRGLCAKVCIDRANRAASILGDVVRYISNDNQSLESAATVPIKSLYCTLAFIFHTSFH